MADTKISEACERCGRCRQGDFANCKNARNLAEASRDALPFVAYAYSQGIEGAEEAGRAVESALEAAPLHTQPAELAEQQGNTLAALAVQAGAYEYGDPEARYYDFSAEQLAKFAALAATGKQKVDPTWSLHDRVEFALRDAGFDLDEASRIALQVDGKQQVGEDCTAILSARIAFEVELCGSLQRAAKELGIDVGYLSRLARGEKTNPSDEVLEKFGLERTVTYTAIKREYVASPLHPRTKSA